jgi:LPS export ABC transporter protein LptC
MLVALVGVATAIVVYLNLGERRAATRPDQAPQLPPRAVLQSDGGVLRFFRRGTQEYEVRSARSITYDDGSTRSFDVTIAATDEEGRDFVITAGEAYAAPDNVEIELRDTVQVRERNGLELSTDRAIFDQETGAVRAEGPVSFTTGRLTGRGTGMTYDDRTAVLRIVQDARLALAPTDTADSVDVRAAGATLDRLRHRLMLDGPARIEHGMQVTTTLAALARLTPEEDRVTFLELRGESHVAGGDGALQSMRAEAIDLEYAEDGQTVERASLRGQASLILAEGNDARRELQGGTVDVTLRAGNMLDRVAAGGGVMMTLPAAAASPPSTVQAQTLTATAGADGTLREAVFTDDVRFVEPAGEGMRDARSRTLRVVLEAGKVERARFGGSATFSDGRLQARAADADYHPGGGRLLLRGSDAQGGPRVTDDGIAIEAAEIDIELQSRGVAARGGVKTSLRAGGERAAGGGDAAGRLPGLLQQDEPVRITAGALAYSGEAGAAVYTGRARLLQGEATEIRAQTIDVQRERGDLTARGEARSILVFGTERSTGTAESIRYVDDARTITYDAADDPAARARLTGPQGDLRGRRIEVQLAAQESRVETLVATGGVITTVDDRTVHGGALTYHARDERYVVTGSGAAPVRVEEQVNGTCREMRGRTLTFTRSADTMVVDGQGESRTQTVRRDACR